jgi:FkbM family methyltransferase
MDPIRRDTRVGNARHRVPARLGGHAVGNWCLYKDAGVNYKPSVSKTTFRSLLTPVSGFRETAKSLRPSVATQKVRDRLDWVRFARALDVKGGLELIRLGSNYGGYVIPANVIEPDWICYSGGLGEDITFEIELAKRYGSTVYGFDPTPQSAEHVKSAALDNGCFVFHSYGLWSSDTELRFYAPRDAGHVSHSIANLQQTERFFVAQCRSLPSLMAEFGHDRLDFLKLDIEGAEYEVLRSMAENGISVKLLCVDLHRVESIERMVEVVNGLRASAYVPVHVHRTDVTFISSELV